MIYKIIYNSKTIILSDEKILSDTEFISFKGKKELTNELELFMNNITTKLIIFHENISVLFNSFSSNFRLIDAAGGVVQNNQNKFLVINRFDKWDLPKGKKEKGENIEETALREVEEECSISQLKIEYALPTTYHIYEDSKSRLVLKRTFWFLMTTPSEKIPIPQTEEGITIAKWAEKHELEQMKQETFENLVELFQFAINYS